MQISRLITSLGASAGYSFRGSGISGVLFVVPERTTPTRLGVKSLVFRGRKRFLGIMTLLRAKIYFFFSRWLLPNIFCDIVGLLSYCLLVFSWNFGLLTVIALRSDRNSKTKRNFLANISKEFFKSISRNIICYTS